MKFLQKVIHFLFIKKQLVVAAFVMLIGIWISSGTLSPYANSLPDENEMLLVLDSPCGYLYNGDHSHHKAVFEMLDGAAPSKWEFSVVIRRVLFPLMAYPLMKLFGYEIGGTIAGILLNIIVFFIFIAFIRKNISSVAAQIMMWLLALYPGIMYWAGLPYAYTCIVPFTLLLTLLLFKISEADKFNFFLLYFFLMGILFTGYDLITFFLPATFFVLYKRRKYTEMPFAVIMMVTPSLISNFLLYSIFNVSYQNNNTAVYTVIINAYLAVFHNLTNPHFFIAWFKYVVFERNIIIIFINVFFKSNFYLLPLLFILIYSFGRFKYSFKLSTIEISILLATFLLFLFNNLAPQYKGWQMRGDWIARLYQPVFIAFVLYIARFFHSVKPGTPLKKVFIGIFVLFLLGNAVIILGPITKNRVGEKVYLDFYRLYKKSEMIKNLDKYGCRPLGICN